jgi:hypothetical protein
MAGFKISASSERVVLSGNILRIMLLSDDIRE